MSSLLILNEIIFTKLIKMFSNNIVNQQFDLKLLLYILIEVVQ